jgi:hypothetical protein
MLMTPTLALTNKTNALSMLMSNSKSSLKTVSKLYSITSLAGISLSQAILHWYKYKLKADSHFERTDNNKDNIARFKIVVKYCLSLAKASEISTLEQCTPEAQHEDFLTHQTTLRGIATDIQNRCMSEIHEHEQSCGIAKDKAKEPVVSGFHKRLQVLKSKNIILY